MLRSKSVGLLTLALVAASSGAYAVPDPTRTVNVQGSLDTSSGLPANGDFTLAFALYAAVSGGDAVYSQPGSSVTVAQGLFDVDLGPVPEGVFESADILWLETSVDGVALPRRPVRPVAYSVVAREAKTALVSGDLDCTVCVSESEIATGAVAWKHLQDGAVSSEKVDFLYAGASDTKGGAANDVECGQCVESGDLAANIELGQLAVKGSV